MRNIAQIWSSNILHHFSMRWADFFLFDLLAPIDDRLYGYIYILERIFMTLSAEWDHKRGPLFYAFVCLENRKDVSNHFFSLFLSQELTQMRTFDFMIVDYSLRIYILLKWWEFGKKWFHYSDPNQSSAGHKWMKNVKCCRRLIERKMPQFSKFYFIHSGYNRIYTGAVYMRLTHSPLFQSLRSFIVSQEMVCRPLDSRPLESTHDIITEIHFSSARRCIATTLAGDNNSGKLKTKQNQQRRGRQQ